MKRLKAFTLIELLIAMSIAALLTAIAIPSFSVFNQRNDLESAAQQISACLQKAQRLSVSPNVNNSSNSSIWLTSATLTNISTTVVGCAVYQYPATTSLSDSSLSGTPVDSVTVNNIQISNVVTTAPVGTVGSGPYVLYFNGLQAGIPVQLTSSRGNITNSNNGFSTSLDVVPVNSNDKPLTITVSATGEPIGF